MRYSAVLDDTIQHEGDERGRWLRVERDDDDTPSTRRSLALFAEDESSAHQQAAPLHVCPRCGSIRHFYCTHPDDRREIPRVRPRLNASLVVGKPRTTRERRWHEQARSKRDRLKRLPPDWYTQTTCATHDKTPIGACVPCHTKIERKLRVMDLRQMVTEREVSPSMATEVTMERRTRKATAHPWSYARLAEAA